MLSEKIMLCSSEVSVIRTWTSSRPVEAMAEEVRAPIRTGGKEMQFFLSKIHFPCIPFYFICIHFSELATYHIIYHHIISYHIISYRIVSYRIISYHIISYHIGSGHLSR